VQGCAWVFVCSSCCAPFWHGFAFALLCLGFSLAQPALFARIYTSFPFGLTSPPAISCRPPSPHSLPLDCASVVVFVLLVVSPCRCRRFSIYFFFSLSFLFLQLRKNAGITFFHSILLSAGNVHPQGRFDSQGCHGADKTGKHPSFPELSNEMANY